MVSGQEEKAAVGTVCCSGEHRPILEQGCAVFPVGKVSTMASSWERMILEEPHPREPSA